MAMNSTNLGNEMKAAIEATGATVTDQAILNAIASAIITHIQTNGVISTNVPGTGLIGYSGTPISGVAAGTGTIS